MEYYSNGQPVGILPPDQIPPGKVQCDISISGVLCATLFDETEEFCPTCGVEQKR